MKKHNKVTKQEIITFLIYIHSWIPNSLVELKDKIKSFVLRLREEDY